MSRARWSWPLLTAALVCGLLGAGCRTLDVQVSPDTAPRARWSVAFLPLDDGGVCEGKDRALFGATGPQGSGPIVARELACAFASNAAFRPVCDADLRRLLPSSPPSPRDLAHLDDAGACRLGQTIGADMVVRGRIAAYRTRWFLFVPRSEVSVELVALDPAANRILWTAAAAGMSHVRSESDLVARFGQDIVNELGPRLTAPAAIAP